MTITSQLLEAYVKCSTKCWLRCAGENATGNAYAMWAQAKNEACRVDRINRLIAEVPDGDRVVASPTENLKTATWRIAIAFQARMPNLETRIPIVELRKVIGGSSTEKGDSRIFDSPEHLRNV